MFAQKEDIELALERLGKQMLYYYVDPISLVICGGSALNIMNIADRTTKDVDVLVIVEETENGFDLQFGIAAP